MQPKGIELPADHDDRIRQESERAAVDQVELIYTRVLGSDEDGKAILQDILVDLNFFEPIENNEMMIRHNQALLILRKMGIWKPEVEGNCKSIVDALLTVPKI